MYNVKSICAAIASFSIITVSHAAEKSMPSISFITIRNVEQEKNIQLKIPGTGTYKDIYDAYKKQENPPYFFVLKEVGRILRPSDTYRSVHLYEILLVDALDLTDFKIPEGSWSSKDVWSFYLQWLNNKKF